MRSGNGSSLLIGWLMFLFVVAFATMLNSKNKQVNPKNTNKQEQKENKRLAIVA